MTSPRKARLIAAELTAAITLFLAVLYVARFYNPTLPALATYTGGAGSALLAIFLSIATFVLSLRVRSPAIAGILIAAGVLMQVPPLQAIAEAGAILIPGPVLGVISFAPILVLGVAKAIGLKTKVVKERTPNGGYAATIFTTISANALRVVDGQVPNLVVMSSIVAFTLSLAILLASDFRRSRFLVWGCSSSLRSYE